MTTCRSSSLRTEAAAYVFRAWAPGEAPPSDRFGGRGFGQRRARTGGGLEGGRSSGAGRSSWQVRNGTVKCFAGVRGRFETSCAGAERSVFIGAHDKSCQGRTIPHFTRACGRSETSRVGTPWSQPRPKSSMDLGRDGPVFTSSRRDRSALDPSHRQTLETSTAVVSSSESLGQCEKDVSIF